MANNNKRKYPFSDGDFAEKCDSIMLAANRDLAALADFGVNTARLAAIQTVITAFKDLPDDTYYSALMMVATSAKNDALNLMTNLLQGNMSRVRVKFGDKSPIYQGMNWESYYKLSQAEKVHRARTISKKMTDLLTDLSSEGLTAAKITELNDAISATDAALSAKDEAVDLRDNKAKERVDTGNNLYTAISGICEYGKELWRDADESKYNDYVMQPSPEIPVQVFSGTLTGGAIVQPSVTLDGGSQVVKISNNGTQAFVVYCAAEIDDPVPPAAVTVPAGSDMEKTAAELGFSTAAFRLLLSNVANTESTEYSGVVMG